MVRGGVIEQTLEPKAAPRKDFRELPILFAFVYWWFYVVPVRILTLAKQVVKKLFLFFSIDLLFKTLLEPWKRDEIDTTNMSLQDKARVLMMNLVSRLVGAVVRSGAIVIGLGTIVGALLLGIIGAIVVVGLPAISIVLFILTLI